MDSQTAWCERFCPLRALHTAPLPPRLLVADADEAATDAFSFLHPFCLLSFCPHPFQVQGAEFFTLFACSCLFARALFRYKVLSDERKAVARLERCFERCPRPASTLRCQKSERLDFIFPSRIHARARITFPVSRATLTHGFLTFIHSFPPPFSPFSRVLPAFRLLLRVSREIIHMQAGRCGARDCSYTGGLVR